MPPGFDPDPRFRWIVVSTEFGQEHLALAHVTELVGCAFLPQWYDPPRTAGAKRMRLHRARARAAADHRAKGLDRTWLARMQRLGKLSEPTGPGPQVDPDVVPLFPGYLMAHVDLGDDRWRLIHSRHGVADVVRIAGGVGAVPQAAMDHLWKQCTADGVIRPLPPPERVKPGTRVRVAYTGDPAADSPFAGLEGICKLSKRDRIALLHAILGRETVVWVPRRLVEVVESA